MIGEYASARAGRGDGAAGILALQEGHWHTAGLGHVLHVRTYGRGIGDDGLEWSPGHEKVYVGRQHLLPKKASVCPDCASIDDDELDPEPGQRAEQVDVVVYRRWRFLGLGRHSSENRQV